MSCVVVACSGAGLHLAEAPRGGAAAARGGDPERGTAPPAACGGLRRAVLPKFQGAMHTSGVAAPLGNGVAMLPRSAGMKVGGACGAAGPALALAVGALGLPGAAAKLGIVRAGEQPLGEWHGMAGAGRARHGVATPRHATSLDLLLLHCAGPPQLRCETLTCTPRSPSGGQVACRMGTAVLADTGISVGTGTETAPTGTVGVAVPLRGSCCHSQVMVAPSHEVVDMAVPTSLAAILPLSSGSRDPGNDICCKRQRACGATTSCLDLGLEDACAHQELRLKAPGSTISQTPEL